MSAFEWIREFLDDDDVTDVYAKDYLIDLMIDVIDAANAAPIKDCWEDNYCNSREGEELYQAQQALKNSLDALKNRWKEHNA